VSNCDTITLHIPYTHGIGVPTGGADDEDAWLTFPWPHKGAQTVTVERDELVWCVACALSEERRAEVLNEVPVL